MTRPDRTGGRVALVALAVLGLLAAAVALPPPGGPPGDRTVGIGDGDGDSPTADDGGGGGVFIRPPLALLEWLFRLLGVIDLEGPAGPAPPPLNVSVQPEPVPGRVVTVTVTYRGEPVEDARVAFDGRPVGRTDARGQVSGEVPYERRFVVTVTPPPDFDPLPLGTDEAARPADAAAAPPGGARPSIVAAGVGGGAPGAAMQSTPPTTPSNRTQENATESYVISDPVRLRVTGEPDPGETVRVAASVRDVPMRDARVAVDGEVVGRTDDRGRYALTIPDDGTERLEVRVAKGEFAGTETVVVRLLQARIEPGSLVALPGGPATVVATVADEPAAGAVVELDGRRLGTTGADGGLAFRLPLDPRATVTVRAADQTATVGLFGLYAVPGALLAVGLVAIGAVVTFARRRATLPADPGRAASSILDRFVRLALSVAIWVADRLGWLLRRLGGALRRAWRFARGIVGGLLGLLSGGAGEVAARLHAFPSRALALARFAVRSIRRAPGRLLAYLLARLRARTRESGAGAGGDPRAASARGRGLADLDLVELWRAFARQVAPGEWPRRTPGEVARRAVERGFPAGAVDTVTETFRDAAYGGEAVGDERLGRVRRAVEELTEPRSEPGGDGPGEEGP